MAYARTLSEIETMPPDQIGRVSYEAPPRLASAGDEIFEAILFPNRSLPPAGFALVMGVVIAVNVTLGVFFTSIGAWPVLGFCGLDIFLVWLAFKLSYRQGRHHERIHITADCIRVSRVLPSGHESRWSLQPFWTQVSVDHAGEHHVRVRLTSKGRSLFVGTFLSPREREQFGDAIAAAVVRARQGQGGVV